MGAGAAAGGIVGGGAHFYGVVVLFGGGGLPPHAWGRWRGWALIWAAAEEDFEWISESSLPHPLFRQNHLILLFGSIQDEEADQDTEEAWAVEVGDSLEPEEST